MYLLPTYFRSLIMRLSVGLILVFSLSACGGGSSGSVSNENTDQAVEPAPEQPTSDDNSDSTPLPIDDVLLNQPVILTVNGFEVDSAAKIRFEYVDTGGKVLAQLDSAGLVIEEDTLLTIIPTAVGADGDIIFSAVNVYILDDPDLAPVSYRVVDLPDFETSSDGVLYASSLRANIISSVARVELLRSVADQGHIAESKFQEFRLREERQRALDQAVLDEFLTQGTISYREYNSEDEILVGPTLTQTEATRLDRSLMMSYSSVNVFSDTLLDSVSSYSIDSVETRRSGYAESLSEEQLQFLRDKYNELLSGRLSELIRDSQGTDFNGRSNSVDNLADQLESFIPDIRARFDDGVDGAKQLLALYGITVAGGTVIFSTGAPLVDGAAALAGLMQQVVAMPASLAINGYTNDNTDAFLRQNGDDFDWNAEAVSTIARLGFAALSVLPEGVISGLSNLLGQAAEVKDTMINAQTAFCTSSKSPRSMRQSKEVVENDFCGIPIADDPMSTGVHPCHSDSGLGADAYWLWYRRIFGGGGFSTYEYGGAICWSYTTNYYYEYKGSGLVGYDCDSDWENCVADPMGYYEYSDVLSGEDGSTSYYYNDGDAWGVRIPIVE